MANSAEDLRGLLKKIREDIGRMPRALPAAPPAPAPLEDLPLPQAPVRSADFNAGEELDEPTFYAEHAEPARLAKGKEFLSVVSAAFAWGRFFQVLWQAGSLAAAAAGAFGDNNYLLALGLLSFSVSLLAGFFIFANSSGSAGEDLSVLGEVARKVDGLERRVASISFSAESGGVSKELEEEIHELRRILVSLMKSLETSPEPSLRPERRQEE